MTTDSLDFDVDRMVTLAGLLTCASRDQLKAAWLDLTHDQRRELRPNRALGQHAWNLIIRANILAAAASRVA